MSSSEYRIPSQRRAVEVITYLALIVIGIRSVAQADHWSIMLWFSIYLSMMAVGAALPLLALFRGNPPVWKVVGDTVEVINPYNPFRRMSFEVGAVRITHYRSLPMLGSTTISDGTRSVTLLEWDFPPAQRERLRAALGSTTV